MASGGIARQIEARGAIPRGPLALNAVDDLGAAQGRGGLLAKASALQEWVARPTTAELRRPYRPQVIGGDCRRNPYSQALVCAANATIIRRGAAKRGAMRT